jgi:three-Cys-motif partner protein
LTDDFFKERREWSRWKHRLLYRYLGKFSAIVGSAHKRVYYIDGFAGEGRYKEPLEDGSPVIAAKLAIDSPPGRKHELRCINIEPEGFDALCESTAEYGEVVENRRGTFRENLDYVLAKIDDCPALFFLDPLGHKGMEWDVVSRVVRRSSRYITEVLLNFYVTKINVHGGRLHSAEPGAGKFVKALDALFGTTEWRSIWEQTAGDERLLALTDLYMQRLRAAFGGAGAVVARYPVRKIDGELKYFMVFGSATQHGGRAMSDCFFRVEREYEAAVVDALKAEADAKGQLFIFPPAVLTEEERDAEIVRNLVPEILKLVPHRKPITFIDVEDVLLTKWFGRALEKHYRAAFVCLLEQQHLIRVSGEPSRKSKRTIVKPTDVFEIV